MQKRVACIHAKWIIAKWRGSCMVRILRAAGDDDDDSVGKWDPRSKWNQNRFASKFTVEMEYHIIIIINHRLVTNAGVFQSVTVTRLHRTLSTQHKHTQNIISRAAKAIRKHVTSSYICAAGRLCLVPVGGTLLIRIDWIINITIQFEPNPNTWSKQSKTNTAAQRRRNKSRVNNTLVNK